uniref:Uncharacterized protein n=1 Tax=Seriola dumerili TaxID=41447 RepID=A0A3B4UHE1_SERDU
LSFCLVFQKSISPGTFSCSSFGILRHSQAWEHPWVFPGVFSLLDMTGKPPNSLWMSELFTLSLRLIPRILRRKLVSEISAESGHAANHL